MQFLSMQNCFRANMSAIRATLQSFIICCYAAPCSPISLLVNIIDCNIVCRFPFGIIATTTTKISGIRGEIGESGKPTAWELRMFGKDWEAIEGIGTRFDATNVYHIHKCTTCSRNLVDGRSISATQQNRDILQLTLSVCSMHLFACIKYLRKSNKNFSFSPYFVSDDKESWESFGFCWGVNIMD